MSDKLGNTGNRNTGNRNTGDWNTGHRNTGNRNTGNRNTGDWNTGDCNTGQGNAGNRNTGDCNTGHRNTGNRNTGDWNAGDCNTGYCNTETPTVRMFDKDTGMKDGEITFPDFFYFNLTEWISEDEMTDREKEAYPSYVTTGGYLKCYDYKQAFQESYRKASQEDKDKVKELPNFDADKFYKISGIRVDKDDDVEAAIKLLEAKGRLKDGKILS